MNQHMKMMITAAAFSLALVATPAFAQYYTSGKTGGSSSGGGYGGLMAAPQPQRPGYSAQPQKPQGPVSFYSQPQTAPPQGGYGAMPAPPKEEGVNRIDMPEEPTPEMQPEQMPNQQPADVAQTPPAPDPAQDGLSARDLRKAKMEELKKQADAKEKERQKQNAAVDKTLGENYKKIMEKYGQRQMQQQQGKPVSGR